MMAKKRSVENLKLILVSGEGLDEASFLNFLKSNFSERCDGLKITILPQSGGGPLYIVQQTIRRSRNKSYDKIIVLMDTVPSWCDETKKAATDYGVDLIGSPPCLEGLLIEILEGRKIPQSGSVYCKKEFEKKYLDSKRKKVHENYIDIFKGVDWSAARSRMPELERLFVLMFDGKIRK